MRRMTPNTTFELTPISTVPLSSGDVFRSNVKRLMVEQNLSQQAFADRLTTIREKRVYRERVADLLSGDHDPTIGWVELVARALDVSIAEILEEKDYR